jgi:hypothetical protein
MDVSIAAEMTMRNGQVQLLLAAKLMMERYASAKWFASCAHRASQIMTFVAWVALASQQCATTSLLWQRFVAWRCCSAFPQWMACDYAFCPRTTGVRLDMFSNSKEGDKLEVVIDEPL